MERVRSHPEAGEELSRNQYMETAYRARLEPRPGAAPSNLSQVKIKVKVKVSKAQKKSKSR